MLDSQRDITIPTIVLFISDHGEAPLLGTYHETRLHSHFHVEIPLLLWANNAYRQHHAVRWKQLARNKHRPISLIDLSYALADLANIRGVKDLSRRSFFSTHYEPFERTTLHGSVGYDTGDGLADKVTRARGTINALCGRVGQENCGKLWAHRINSIGSLMQAAEIVAGVEIDVVFDTAEHRFKVHHPPAPDVGLSLDKLLRLDDGKRGYWLDWKNSSAQAMSSALARLQELHDQFGIRGRTIVETASLHSQTAALKDAGWMSSYYLPTDKILAAQKTGDSTKSTTLAHELLEHIKTHHFDAISFDMRVRSFVAKYMEATATSDGLRAFAWEPKTKLHKAKGKRLDALATDPFVEVTLVGFTSPFDL